MCCLCTNFKFNIKFVYILVSTNKPVWSQVDQSSHGKANIPVLLSVIHIHETFT